MEGLSILNKYLKLALRLPKRAWGHVHSLEKVLGHVPALKHLFRVIHREHGWQERLCAVSIYIFSVVAVKPCSHPRAYQRWYISALCMLCILCVCECEYAHAG